MTKETSKVAIITRTKDRTLLLERAIQSVHNQTMRDFVHVIINDAGDTAPVDSLVQKYETLIAGRVKVIHNQESFGMEAASNAAIKSVESVYVAIHDDDDTWHSEFLERALALLETQDAQGVVVRTNKRLERLDGGEVKIIKTEQWMPDMKSISLYRQCIDNQMTPITFIFSRKAYNMVGGFDESLPVLGDWDFGIRFLKEFDVEYLDPGFALANYHHRIVNHRSSNANYSSTEKHRYYSTKLMNKYLREELSKGQLGVGYIMSQLKYNQSNLASIAKKMLPTRAVNIIKKRIQN